jgi:hypothetical protein
MIDGTKIICPSTLVPGRSPVAVVEPMSSSSAIGSAKVNSAYSALRQNERCSRSAWRKARLTVWLSSRLR